ncbi:MAG: hypothetical protein VX681_01185 [Myxococcota bacterium]|nr:hypothetical protein [Myxococcota bacterium]
MAADALAGEAGQGVERAQLTGSAGRMGDQRADASQVAPLDEDTERVGQHRLELLIVARHQEALLDTAADQVVRAIELVQAQRSHLDVALAREEGAHSRIGEQLVGERFGLADGYGRQAGVEHRADLAQQPGALGSCTNRLVDLVPIDVGQPPSPAPL